MELTFEDTSLEKGIIEQVAFLIATPMGTVVCDRDFGLDMGFIDKPLDIAESMFASELSIKLARYIPAVKLVRVTFKLDNPNAKINARMVIAYA